MRDMNEYVAPEILVSEIVVEAGIAISEVTTTSSFGFTEYEEVDM